MTSAIRVAICGAGPSGLSQLHAFESARQSGIEIPEIVCFEKQNDLGGHWNYTWRTGYDEYGEPIHQSMYENLWTNLPKECSEFLDYSFDEHFGQPLTSFPPRSVLYDYIRGYAERNNIRQYIQFNTVIRWISYSEEQKKFHVIVRDLQKDQTRTEEFDYVIVATGHFSTPNVPSFQGIETFPGRILHSHDFRSARDFSGQHVLLIGNGFSAEDIALQLYKYGAKSITITYRTKPKNFKWPDGIKEVPLLTKIDQQTVYFNDGSFEAVQSIIFCTGYLYSFPYLDEPLRLKTRNDLCPTDLYKTIFWIHHPRLFYLGMQRVTFSFNISNIQAWYVRGVILGTIHLPSKQEMLDELASCEIKTKSIQSSVDYIQYQREHVLDLLKTANYPTFDINRMIETLMTCIRSRYANILTYREKTYSSTITDTMAKEHHTPWLNEFNDRLENFIQIGQ